MGDFRAASHRFLNEMIVAPDATLPSLLDAHLTPDTVWNVAFSINRQEGLDAVLEGLILLLLADMRRRGDANDNLS